MINLKNLYDNTKQLSDHLYQNTPESYESIPDYIKELQGLIEMLMQEQKQQLCQDIYTAAQSLVSAYQQMSMIQLADILKENLLPLIGTATGRGHDAESDASYHPESDIKVSISDEWMQKNIDAIPQIKRPMYVSLKDFLDQVDQEDQTITMDLNGSIAVLQNEQWWNLSSTVDSQYAAQQWMNAQAKMNENDIIIVCGMSNCSYIRQIAKNLSKENIMVVYEPDARVFAANFIYTDMSDLLSMDQTFFLVEGMNMNLHNSVLSGLVNCNTIKYTKFYALPGYDVAYQDKINDFMEKSKKTFENLQLINNTILQKSKNVNYDVIMNLKFMMMDSNIDELKKSLEQANVTDLPAIIVAAGPSLDKNIQYLSKAKDKAFIIAVDSAIRMLMKYDIMPDMIVTLDPDKERVLFEDDRVNDIPLLYSVHGTYDIINRNRSRKFVYCNMSFIHQLYEKLDYQISTIDPGGSVANAGFAMARYLGYQTIIMIGQDLAFTDNKKHASVVYQDVAIGSEGDVYTTVEGINGEELLTYINFKAYRDWYENVIEYSPDLNFINATEGGAKIHGAMHMRLIDAINQYCTREARFSQIIANSGVTFDQEHREKFVQIVKGYIDDCEMVWRTSRDLIHSYDQMMTLRDEGKLAKLAKKTDTLVSQLEKEPVMEFISYYSRAEENDATSDLYDETSQDIRSICKNLGERGRKVAVSYQKYALQTKELFEQSYKQLCECIEE